ncbi:BMP family ABC transporter substrate-binding protein [Cohnella endophytica]|uniref:BMP family ABC transporter substrate-binding protein n=1 Tax=Cohnella endophytica TaxID=2419778 RepID=A0A494XX60_9BACL|nr:BMP family ABC transporter substrate-binding protein [Cohnella endophytica]RKP54294.1 BMP family ABC transporter substrate-binding protein [Cohnella endophytica]
MKKSTKIFTGIMLVASLALTACGAKNNTNNGASSPSASAPASPSASADNSGKGFKIAMVTDVGGVNDKSFNQGAWEGLKKLEADTGASVKYLESKEATNYLTNMNQFVRDKYNLTWGIGFLMGDAVKDAATKNPDAQLAIIDNVVDAPNVASITFAENEGSFLVGVVAGLTTKTNKIGFVGGIEIPVIKRFELGFVAGVKAVNPDAKVTVVYTGAFDKADLGKAAAASLYNDKNDIIFHAAGGTGNGVFNEAKERNKTAAADKKVWVIGVDKDQSIEFGDDVTLTSMLKRVDQAVYTVSKELIAGDFPAGKITVLGLKDDAVGLPDTSSKNVSKEILDKVEEYKQKIISGEITVPTAQ